MMTHAQLKRFIAEAIILLILGAVFVVGGYFISQDNADRRMQNEYHSRFDTVLNSYAYEKIKSKALSDFPEIKGVYLGLNATGAPEGYVVDLVVKSPEGRDLSMLVALDYESTRIVGLALNPNDSSNAFEISDSDMSLINEKLAGRQIPVAFLTEDNREDDENADKPVVSGLKDGVYYAQRLFDDRNRYIDYVEMEVENGVIKKVKWDAFSTDKTNQDRSEASLKGAYVISGLDWATQSYNLCHALLECQDPDRLAMKSDGTTDIVSGVTCDIRPFVELAKECISNSRAGYNKTSYMRGLNVILNEVMKDEEEGEAEKYIRDDGNIVFSFEKTPEIYTIYNDDEEAVGFMGVRQAVAALMGVTLADDTDSQDSGDQDADAQSRNTGDYDSGEDGIIIGGNADDRVFSDSLDDLPMSEMQSFITPVEGAYEQTRTVIKACNTCYKFLKEYLNWKV
ncbi:MAG: hypothetical protein K5779_02675 [Saccharofermentans sp.]|nr:hypothetical protein [Saccharofermentans sp.]